MAAAALAKNHAIKEDPNVNARCRVGKEAIHLNLLIRLPLVRFYRILFTNVNLWERKHQCNEFEQPGLSKLADSSTRMQRNILPRLLISNSTNLKFA